MAHSNQTAARKSLAKPVKDDDGTSSEGVISAALIALPGFAKGTVTVTAMRHDALLYILYVLRDK